MLPFDSMLQSLGYSSDRDHLTPMQFALVADIPVKEVLHKIETGQRQGKWNVIRKTARDFLTGEPVEIIHIPIAEARKQYDHIRAITASWWGWAIPNHFGRR